MGLAFVWRRHLCFNHEQSLLSPSSLQVHPLTLYCGILGRNKTSISPQVPHDVSHVWKCKLKQAFQRSHSSSPRISNDRWTIFVYYRSWDIIFKKDINCANCLHASVKNLVKGREIELVLSFLFLKKVYISTN